MNSRRWRKHRHKEAGDLAITAFMNLMVILTPFLLITAVFSKLAVLELNLPASQSTPSEAETAELDLEITVRDSMIEVGDRRAGLLKRIENTADGHDLQTLAAYLKDVKARFPQKTDATLLLEPDISYQTVVEVMDTVRVAERMASDGTRMVKSQLFPEIAIGDAPLAD